MSVYCELVGSDHQPVCYKSEGQELVKTYTYTDIPSQLLFFYEMLLFPLADWSPLLERNKHLFYGMSLSARLDKDQVEQLVRLKVTHIPEMAIASTKDSTDIFLPTRITREQAAAFLASAICLQRGEAAPKFSGPLDGAPDLCHALLYDEESILPLPFRAERPERIKQDAFVIRFHAEHAGTTQYNGWLEEHYSRFGEKDPAHNEMYIAVSSRVLKSHLGNMLLFARELQGAVSAAAGLFSKEEAKSRAWWKHEAYRALCMLIPGAWAASDPVPAPAFSLEV